MAYHFCVLILDHCKDKGNFEEELKRRFSGFGISLAGDLLKGEWAARGS